MDKCKYNVNLLERILFNARLKRISEEPTKHD